MHESRIASPYAKSLLSLAQEKGILEQVKKDMDLFVAVCKENTMLLRVIKNPIISQDKKEKILTSLFKGRFNDLTLAMFSIINRKNREAYLYDIALEFVHQYKQLKGIQEAEVTSAFTLTTEQKEAFAGMVAKISGKKAELKEKIDESIIGGFILKVEDRQVDESIKSKLEKLKSSFKDNSYISKL